MRRGSQSTTVIGVLALVGFVGLITPHAMRLVIGPDNRLLLPASALGGAIFLIIADLAARTILSPSELPVGALTAIIGAPFFIALVMRRRHELSGAGDG